MYFNILQIYDRINILDIFDIFEICMLNNEIMQLTKFYVIFLGYDIILLINIS
jgi:hypothetical protein